MDEKNNLVRIKKFVLKLLLWEGIIAILFLSFFSCSSENQEFSNEVLALTVTPSVTTSIYSPANLTATAISSSQIDLSWDPVFGASYYKIYRGGASIATTTAVIYSDTGLSPSTTYTYAVSAVDSGGIESSQSSSVSATTLAAAVEEEEEEKGGPALFPSPPEEIFLIINNGNAYTNSLDVNLTLSAKNAFQMAISNVFDFAGGVWEIYQTSKKWTLEPSNGEKTVYAKFRTSEGGVSRVISDSIIFDTIPPINVNDFEALAGDEQITLTWENPPDEDFRGVKIMGSAVFYPSSPSEGIMVYSGKGTSFVALGLTNGRQYYYTAFSYDKAGNYSSGAIVSAVPFREGPPIPPPPPPPPPPLPPLPPEIEKLTLEDFDFWREGRKISLEEGLGIKGETKEPLTVSIDYEKVPEVLKTIMVTLEKPARLPDGSQVGGQDKSFSFLLRINLEKTRYEAVFLLPEEPGIYNLTITVLDYKNQALKKISGYLEVIKPEIPLPPEIPWYRKIEFWFYILLGIIIIAIIGYLIWKARMKKLESSY